MLVCPGAPQVPAQFQHFCQWGGLVDAQCRYTTLRGGQRAEKTLLFFLHCHKIWILFHTGVTNTSCKLWGAILLQKAEWMEKFRPVLLKLGSRWEARCITEQITLGASRGLGENPRPGPGRRAATASLPFVLRDVLLLLLWFFLVESSYLNSSH